MAEEKRIERYIPCLFLEKPEEENSWTTNSILIYFHGNGEDIFQSFELLDYLRYYLNVNMV